MDVFLNRMKNEPRFVEVTKSLSDFYWKAGPESMSLFLSSLKKEFGSVRGYLLAKSAEPSLFKRLEGALLI
jgi:hypothetical protein